METEQWRPVLGYEDSYAVSDAGRIKSIDRVIEVPASSPRRLRQRILNPTILPAGYRQAVFYRDGSAVARLVHRVVLQAFVGPPPGEGFEGCHLNGEPSDNRLVNLRWDTRAANLRDSIRDGKHVGSHAACPQGHPYEGANLRVDKSGVRRCRTCANATARETYRLAKLGEARAYFCERCKCPLKQPARGRPPKWCSDSCRTKSMREATVKGAKGWKHAN